MLQFLVLFTLGTQLTLIKLKVKVQDEHSLKFAEEC